MFATPLDAYARVAVFDLAVSNPCFLPFHLDADAVRRHGIPIRGQGTGDTFIIEINIGSPHYGERWGLCAIDQIAIEDNRLTRKYRVAATDCISESW